MTAPQVTPSFFPSSHVPNPMVSARRVESIQLVGAQAPPEHLASGSNFLQLGAPAALRAAVHQDSKSSSGRKPSGTFAPESESSTRAPPRPSLRPAAPACHALLRTLSRPAFAAARRQKSPRRARSPACHLILKCCQIYLTIRKFWQRPSRVTARLKGRRSTRSLR